jgi:threonine synthase
MKYYSTSNKNNITSFEKAVMVGLAEDGGLYMPAVIPKLEKEFLDSLENRTFQEIAIRVSEKFIDSEIPHEKLVEIINDSMNFPVPLLKLSDTLSVLELFHGPTLAFKDFGARFMAKIMAYFVSKGNKKLNILVATSGDTGSAVAYGFYDVPGINVFILYPKGKVSEIQEKQLTTLDKNITTLEIDGTFDDCQHLVKTAFVDYELSKKMNLTSANSINIARLIPQSFYYFEAYKQIEKKRQTTIFSVPSGNLGNLTAGLIAKKMGLPITTFIGAVNSNNVFSEYIRKGIFSPQPSVQTLSNAMDVGNPSNLIRIQEIYSHLIRETQKEISSNSYNDEQTRKGIKEVYERYNYIIDPHGSVGYLAIKDFILKNFIENYSAVIFETAHAAKFKDIIEEELHIKVFIPERLAICLEKEKNAIQLSKDYNSLKNYLLSR